MEFKTNPYIVYVKLDVVEAQVTYTTMMTNTL